MFENFDAGIQIMATSVMFAVILLFLIYIRMRFQKIVVGKVYCELITREGNEKSKLIPIRDGKLILKPDKTNVIGRMFSIDDIATHTADYPPGWPSFLQAKCKKAVIDEESWEPISNRKGLLLLSPRRLFNIADEKFSSSSVEKSREEIKDDSKIKHRSSGNKVLWIVLIVVVVALVAFGVYYYKNNQALKDAAGISQLIGTYLGRLV